MSHPTFSHLRTVPVPTLRLAVEEYRHEKTGARHFHLASEDTNNVFVVAFLTVPQDDTGVAHILEHTSLCASERYPVRDPFFMMLRRSLNTFMNAFTSSDWTAYPFASQNPKDFDNLLRVYLDAAFFPKLEALDFAQEGHRLEFEDPTDPTTPLVYRGVVFNEMKGAMSSSTRQLATHISRHLYPTTTYHYNSGGEPSAIPDLSHDQLKAFHATHYHPSNALFMTYGNRPAADHQALFEECALHRFERIDTSHLAVADERRYDQPLYVEERYDLAPDQDPAGKTHIVIGWLLGLATSQRDVMRLSLLAGVLLEHSGSPLRHLLETCGLGSAPSPLCGIDSSSREMSFMVGLEGSEADRADALEEQVLGLLRETAEQGVPQEELESVLHQIELSQREISGDGMPYGLRLTVHALSPALHGGDPVEALLIDPYLEELRQDIQNPDFIPGLIREWLLDNPHRVRLVMKPDADRAAAREAAEQARLQKIAAGLDEAAKQALVDQAKALEARQQQEDDPEILPKVGLEDVPETLPSAQGSTRTLAGQPVSWFAQGTNGMVYQQIVVDLPKLEPELQALLPLFCDFVPEMGVGARDYQRAQARQFAVSGGVSARASMRAGVDDVQRTRGYFLLSGKALARNQEALTELLHDTFHEVRFDEFSRMRELVAQIRTDMENSVTGRGSALAAMAAASGLSPLAALQNRWHGLPAIETIRRQERELGEDAAMAALGANLATLRERIANAPRQFLLIGEAALENDLHQSLERHWPTPPGEANGAFGLDPVNQITRQAWVAGSQVNFCVKLYPTVPYDHPDSGALRVLAEFLRNGFLHRAIREQGGAYGGGAGYDSDSGGFKFSSYRDPRLTETLADFDRAVDWLVSTPHPARSLEEAILGVISRFDKPASPAGEAKRVFLGSLHDRTPEQRAILRSRILQTTLADLRRLGETYFQPERASIGVVGGREMAESAATALDLELHRL